MAEHTQSQAAAASERLGPRRAVRLEPRIKLWLEQDGLLVMSEYRAELLGHVAETGSLAQAAQRMGLSYRRAWGKIREIERNLGMTLVESEAGGAGGGCSHLTPEGERLLLLYQRFRQAMAGDLGREFRQLFRE